MLRDMNVTRQQQRCMIYYIVYPLTWNFWKRLVSGTPMVNSLDWTESRNHLEIVVMDAVINKKEWIITCEFNMFIKEICLYDSITLV